MNKNPPFKMALLGLLAFSSLFLSACSRAEPAPTRTNNEPPAKPLHPAFSLTEANFKEILSDATPDIGDAVFANPVRFLDLLDRVLTADPELVRLVDKENLLPAEYEPDDLVDLKELGLKTSRKGLRLRKEAAGALSEMSAAAKKEGIELLASSTYRSFSYQRGLYERNVKEMGREAADRESARPGSSQHQLGTALDFGSISDAFTGTPMELWLKKNAGNFGFSLSYPDGYETETGYRHESWHFRYIGKAAARMEEEFFGGIQQRLLGFLRTRITDFQRYRRN